MNTLQSNTDWREEVTKQANDWLFETDDYIGVNVTLVKQFISQLLEAEKKRWRSEVEALELDPNYSSGWQSGYRLAKQDVLQKLS